MTQSSEPWRDAVTCFEDGVITQHEFVNTMFDLLTVENVWEIGKQIDKKYFDMLAARLSELPDDDEGWSKMRRSHMGSFTGPVTQNEDFSAMRRGVEAFRRYCLIPTKAQKNWKCLCYLCFPEAVEYGELIPDMFLFKDGDTYGLMMQSGHRGDYILLFPEKPTPDPDPECVHEYDEIATSERWVDVVADWQEKLKLFPSEGHHLVESCKEAGWSYKHGHMLFWLFDRAGKMLEGQDVSGQTAGSGSASEPECRVEGEDSDRACGSPDQGGVVGPEGAD
jgi:hypothetical protein